MLDFNESFICWYGKNLYLESYGFKGDRFLFKLNGGSFTNHCTLDKNGVITVKEITWFTPEIYSKDQLKEIAKNEGFKDSIHTYKTKLDSQSQKLGATFIVKFYKPDEVVDFRQGGQVFTTMNNKNQFVYLMINDIGLYKIGISNDPHKRSRDLQNTSGIPVRLLQVYDPNIDARLLETRLHKHYAEYRKKGEWFSLSEEQVSRFDEIAKQYDN